VETSVAGPSGLQKSEVMIYSISSGDDEPMGPSPPRKVRANRATRNKNVQDKKRKKFLLRKR